MGMVFMVFLPYNIFFHYSFLILMSFSFQEKLHQILEKYNHLAQCLASPSLSPQERAKQGKEYTDLSDVAQMIKRLQKHTQEVADLHNLMEDPETKGEMHTFVHQEYRQIKQGIADLEREIKIALLPKDKADTKNAMIEIRPGTGGDEAALFAQELFYMYQRYCEIRKWRFDVDSFLPTDLGGVREASATIKGHHVFSVLKFESGVHRVQRVPSTETSGRIHTSTATVAVLPEAQEIDVKIEDKDLRIDVFRSSGPGGQSVNTTDSAVRITHVPTGLVVQQQDEKSQHKNKAKALKILRSRLYEQERRQYDQTRSMDRKHQIGTGDRSERIRTYNFPQGRVTDHRTHQTLHQIHDVLQGHLDPFLHTLVAEDEARRLLAWESS